MKKSDIILILFVVLFAGGLYFSGLLRPQGIGGEAVIYVDEKEYGRYPLDEECTIDIFTEDGEKNTLLITNGKADMISADCPDQVCVKQRAVSKKNETIICLPHKVVVEIQGDADESEINVIAN